MFQRVAFNFCIKPGFEDSFINLNSPEEIDTVLSKLWVQKKDDNNKRNNKTSRKTSDPLPLNIIQKDPNNSHKDKDYQREPDH